MIGCRINPENAHIISRSAGIGAAVTWIAYDSPDNAEKLIVKDTLSLVQENLHMVSEGDTYTEVIYPIIVEFTKNDKIEERYIPLVLAGSMSILNGIDILFATNPEWKTKSDFALKTANAFFDGAKVGLSFGEDSPAIVQARNMSRSRSAIKKQYFIE
jgi:hypothetical protein